MKKIIISTGNIYIGNAREICSLYKNFLKREIAMPIFSDFPKFNPLRFYGLYVREYDSYTEREMDIPEMQIISSDTVLEMIYS